MEGGSRDGVGGSKPSQKAPCSASNQYRPSGRMRCSGRSFTISVFWWRTVRLGRTDCRRICVASRSETSPSSSVASAARSRLGAATTVPPDTQKASTRATMCNDCFRSFAKTRTLVALGTTVGIPTRSHKGVCVTGSYDISIQYVVRQVRASGYGNLPVARRCTAWRMA